MFFQKQNSENSKSQVHKKPTWFFSLFDSRVSTLIGIGFFLIALILFGRSVLYATIRNATAYTDFTAYYFPAMALRAGLNFYNTAIVNPLASPILSWWKDIGPYLYPPVFLWLIVPLTFVGFAKAKVLWVVVTFICALFLWKEMALAKGKVNFWFASAAILFFFPFGRNFSYGALEIALLLLVLLAFRWQRQGKKTAAGIAIGIAGAFKLYPLFLLLFFVLRKQWKVCIIALCIVICTMAASFAFLPSQTRNAYFSDVVPKLIKGEASQQNYQGQPAYTGTKYWPSNHSLSGLFARTMTQQQVTKGFINNKSLATWSWIVASAVFLATTVYLAVRIKNADAMPLLFSLFILTFLLINPLTWEGYLVFTLPCFLFVFKEFLDRGWKTHLAWIASFGILFIILALRINPWHDYLRSGFGILLMSVKTVAMVLMYCATAYLTIQWYRQQHSAESAGEPSKKIETV